MKIDEHGHLWLRRADKFKKQWCPIAENSAVSQECGDWCPHFGGVEGYEERKITICQGRVLRVNVAAFIDEREATK